MYWFPYVCGDDPLILATPVNSLARVSRRMKQTRYTLLVTGFTTGSFGEPRFLRSASVLNCMVSGTFHCHSWVLFIGPSRY